MTSWQIQQVEADLRTLSVDSRRKHPMVKESAERGILKLRAIAKACGGEGTGVMLQSEDVVRPFVLACNHADATHKMIAQALSAIQKLVSFDGVIITEVPNIMRVMKIQSESAHLEVRARDPDAVAAGPGQGRACDEGIGVWGSERGWE
jgi:hypothetical protein